MAHDPPVTRQPAPPPVANATVGEGRALLRMLEQGSGPSIQIGWPAASPERAKLYQLFVQCFGMQVALADGAGHLYLSEGRPGEPSAFDMERYSGFVRRPEGAMSGEEQREAARLASFHRTDAGPVRVFPRRVDAYLMSGLRQAVGDRYLSMKSVRAVYRLSNGRVVVDSITADGQPVPGLIDLGAVAGSCAG